MNRILVVGFMLFAIFFGAGNLIFPLKLGFESGSTFNYVMFGFILTGAGLPLLGLVASSSCPEGMSDGLSKKVHPLFATVLLTAIFLSIGPLFVIPRTALTSFEIGFVPFLGDNYDHINFIGFVLIFFIASLFCCLNPSRMVNIIGKYLTPCLLLSIAILCATVFFHDPPSLTTIHLDLEKSSAFSYGFLEGYLTMDAIGSIVLGALVIRTIKSVQPDEKNLFANCCKASLIAAVGLATVYLALSWVANHFAIDEQTLQQLAKSQRHLGTYILVEVANHYFGIIGPILVSIIVILACLTTAIGLTSAVSTFFHEKFAILNYKQYVCLFSFSSFVLSNLGLQQVITLSIPVLLILYPLTIMIILMILIDKIITLPYFCYKAVLLLTFIISIVGQLFPHSFIRYLPLFQDSLGWFLPAVIMLIISYPIGKKLEQTQITQ